MVTMPWIVLIALMVGSALFGFIISAILAMNGQGD
jgi:hypothetical protein